MPAAKPVMSPHTSQWKRQRPEDVGGWPKDCVAPSAIAFSDALPFPKALDHDGIERIKKAFVAAARRAVVAGVDVIEIHNAHGYLLHEFLSPVSNKRVDEYGGIFENRTRLTLEIVEQVRAAIPSTMPLFLRISADEWLGELPKEEFLESWTIDETVKLAPLLAERGVDLLDVSSGGNHPRQRIRTGPLYQAPFAQAVKKFVGDRLLVSAVGSITNGKQAEQLLQSGLDAIMCGRWFQKNPGLVWSFAEDLEVEIQLANQIRWGFGGRGDRRKAVEVNRISVR